MRLAQGLRLKPSKLAVLELRLITFGYTPEMLRDVTGAIARSEERIIIVGLRLGYCDVRGRGSIQMLRLLLVGCVLSASGAPSCAWFPYVIRSSDAPPT